MRAKIIFLLIVAILSLVTPHMSYAKGSVYDSCMKRLEGKFSPEKLEKDCLCSQEKLGEAISRGLDREETKAFVQGCFDTSLSSGAVDIFYKNCLDNPKEKGNPRYEEFCLCAAAGFGNAVMSSHKILDKKARETFIEEAGKNATNACLPARHR